MYRNSSAHALCDNIKIIFAAPRSSALASCVNIRNLPVAGICKPSNHYIYIASNFSHMKAWCPYMDIHAMPATDNLKSMNIISEGHVTSIVTSQSTKKRRVRAAESIKVPLANRHLSRRR